MSELRFDTEEARTRLYEIMNRDAPFEAKVQQALELGESYLGVEDAYLSKVDPQTDTWEAIARTDDGDGPFPPGKIDLETTYCRRAIEQDTALAIHDTRSQGWDDDPAFDAQGVACYHGTAITIDDNHYGVVCFVSRRPREPFTDGETMFAELLARLLEQELQRRHHEAKLDRRSNLITVLNRVLRHNLRNSMTVIRAHANMAGKEFRWPPQELQTIIDRADELIDLSEKARKLNNVGDYDCQETDLTELLDRLAADIQASYPSASITATTDESVPLAVQPSLETALYELLENAAKHGGKAPEVTVSVSRVPNGVEITIADDGPGLPKMEQEVLTAGTETPLTHGQGLGLWLAYWIVTSHDGHIDTTVSDAGTRMCIELPRNVPVTGSGPHEERGTQLRHVQDKFRTVFDEASDAMVLVDDEGRIIDANESAGRLLNQPAPELLGHSMAEFVNDGTDFRAAWQATGKSHTDRGTVGIAGSGSEQRTAEYTTTTDIVPDEHLIVLRDITERKARERELRETTRRLEAVIDASPDPIVCVDRDGQVEMWNPAAERTFGWTEPEVLGDRPPIVPADGLDGFEERIAAEQRVDGIETQRRRKDGERIDVNISTAQIRDERGAVTGAVAVIKDISQRKRRERELEVKRRAIEKAPVSTVITDASEPDNPIIYANEAFEELTGYPESEVIGQNCRFLQGPETDEDTVKAIRDAVASADPISVELKNYRRDGTTFWNENTLAPVTDDAGSVTHYVGFQQDITDRRKREQELLQVAHDLQNPLQVAQGRLDMLADDSDHASAATAALSRMEDLITDVLSLADQARPVDDPKSVELSTVADQCWRWVDTQSADLTVEAELALLADASRLQQLLENLFGNALDHGGDDVTVRVGRLPDGFYVADDGVGIPVDERSRVFESGYSTSDDGTGLGLPIVKEVAEAHGWSVSVTESSDGGARFEFRGITVQP